MKYSTATLLTFGAVVMAQDLAGLPKCGQTCVGNMLAIAQSQFGCKAGDVVCYCTNVNFGYGMRDCSNQACSKEDAATVIQFGTAYCQAALQGVASASGAASGLTILSSAAASSSGAEASGASQTPTPASTPVTTTPLVATITSGDSTFVSTTGFATIYGAVTGAAASGASSLTGSAASAASSVASDASSGASSVASAASSAASSVAGSVSSAVTSIAASASSRASSATGGAQSSSSSAGAGPMRTAAPMLGVAAMGALLLI